ncbi:MAG: formate dehydrogenase subunit alpha [Methanocellales archaeon]|nr:formate dehydrogenase subunit alpha [Methanocellales archaeon]MDD3291672.1 formate dehydrogenase subunit alpha [Methanocellales archaeon]MDD5235022.1 formate dehydrogenase subunit alpha [Methanocellales archaeon]MDD5485160.1 formate dehydrogenase subunit alpha [Methanocellales archaeon]
MAAKSKSILSELKMSRRTFAKLTALGAAATLGGYATSKKFTGKLFEKAAAAPTTNLVKTICSHCAVGCGVLGRVEDGELVRMEPWTDHPINAGGMCSKGTSIAEMVNSERRLRYPMKKKDGKWGRISWDEALTEIANKLKDVRSRYGPDSVMWMGSAKMTNEECYLFRKLAAFWGTNNVDHQARICHSTTVAGLANTWGFGAQTNNVNDMRHSKCIFFCGSNAAEAHPVSMQHILEAKDRGARIIVADPRFTRTAAKADLFVRFRSGTTVPLLMGICNVIINNNWHDKKFIDNRTIGFDDFWEVCREYTPEVVEDITWAPADQIREMARMLYENKPSAIVWAMGQTQHTVGTNNIHMSGILNLILGHSAQSGGGCQPFRGHDNVQGSTDACILADNLPAYYGLTEAAWKHWCAVWGVDYDWMLGRFENKELMEKNGFTVSRWYEGVLKPEAEIDQPRNLKVVFVWGHSLNSITQMKKMKEAMEKIDLIVSVDPHSTIATSLADRPDGIIALPASTVFEKAGSVTTTGRQVQWRFKLVEPRYDSRPDMEILLELANKLGFGAEYTKNFRQYPEDVLREMNNGMRSIGMIGQTPERVKRQMENSATFTNRDTLRAEGGPCKGEYWGLPWPCWTDTHCGTPILYDSSKPVSDGGHDFRVRWGVAVPENAHNKHVGESLLRGDNPVPQSGYAYDLTGTEINKYLAAGNPPTGRGRARIWAWNLPDPVPIHREPIESPRPDLVDKYPTYADAPKFFRVMTEYKTFQQSRRNLVERYPIVLTTGRQVEHMGGGAETRSCPYLVELQPEMYVEINPALAADLGVKHWDMVWVETLRGRCKVRAYVTERVPYDEKRKLVFMPYHWAGIFEGESYEDRYPKDTAEMALGDSCNIITVDGYDRVTQMQETKVCLCNVYKA